MSDAREDGASSATGLAAASLLPVFDHIPAVVFLKDLGGRYIFVNVAFCDRFRAEPHAVLGKTDADLFPAAVAEEFRANDRRVFESGTPLMTEERAVYDDGQAHTSIVVKFLTFDSLGQPQALCGVATDISERKRAEEILRRSQEGLAEAQRLAHIGSWEWDLRSHHVTWSDEMYRQAGQEPGQYRPSFEGFLALVHPEDLGRVKGVISECVERRTSASVDYRIVRPDGDVRFITSRGRVVLDAEGQPLRVVGTAQDVTERRALEEQLAVRDRLASVGVLAAGVAHEIKNPLSFVMANLDALGEELHLLTAALPKPQHSEMLAMVTQSLEGARRIRKIVAGLMTFARSGDAERANLDVNEVADLAITMTGNEIRHRARLVRNFGTPPPVTGSTARLGQVITNLLVNAAQALPEGSADQHEIRVTTRAASDGQAVIEVRDTGPGIAPELRHRVFEPFFTTKPVGMGTGLGLSICHGIITAMGGEIELQSQLGHGSTFIVRLPAAAAPASAAAPAESAQPQPPRRAKILVIDDEPELLRAVERLLKGHEVLSLRSPREALACLLGDQPFDLILCDLMMPELNGMDLHAELASQRPERLGRLVFMTGGAFTQSARAFLARVPNEHLDKPFDPATLRALVQRYLNRTAK